MSGKLALVLGVAGLALCTQLSLAENPGPPIHQVGNLQIEKLKGLTSYMVMIGPADKSGKTTPTRSYTFSDRGTIQIFNDFAIPGGNNSNSTGARTFWVFPRLQKPTEEDLSANELEVVTSAGDHVRFKAGTLPEIEDSPSYSVRLVEDPEINQKNHGGVEIEMTPHSKTIVIDNGFHLGDYVSSRAKFFAPTAHSTVSDGSGHKCVLSNSQLFVPKPYDVAVKYATDQALFGFLHKACPNLDLPSLASRAQPAGGTTTDTPPSAPANSGM